MKSNDTSPHDDSGPVFAYVLIKLATRCNLDCAYCYWFRDRSVYDKPKLLTNDSELAFVRRLEAHLIEHTIEEFTILLHGGEPLLFGKARFATFLERLDGVQQRTGTQLVYLITTNGVLVDQEWAALFRRFGVYVSISIDGPPNIHDSQRVDFAGRGSHAAAVNALHVLRAAGLKPGVIAVCNVDYDPVHVLRHIVDELCVQQFDILPPDATHEDRPPSIAAYYIRLFDSWYDAYAERGVRITIIEGVIGGLLGNEPITDSIGTGPVHTVTMLTDGSLEPLDVLRIGGGKRTRTDVNIKTHRLQEIALDPVWSRAYNASLELCSECRACKYYEACGGGHLAHRWSDARGWNNPSVYCSDWKAIFEHVWRRITPDLDLLIGDQRVPLVEALAAIGAPVSGSGHGRTAALPAADRQESP